MERPSLEEAYVTAWRIIAPGAEAPEVVVKKWPRGRVHQLTMPGLPTMSLRCDEFVRCLQAVEALATIFAKHRPVAIGPDGYPSSRPPAFRPASQPCPTGHAESDGRDNAPFPEI